MSQLIKREQLEEIMLSFVFKLYDENNIEFINQDYSDYEKRKYIFPLSKTELYFKQFVITYCRQNCNLIVDRVNFTNPQNRNTFIYNFRQNENPVEELSEIDNSINQPLVANNGDGHNENNNNRHYYYYIICVAILLLFFAWLSYYIFHR